MASFPPPCRARVTATLTTTLAALLAFIAGLATLPAAADDSATFFDPSVVKEVRITFTDPNWFQALQASHATDPADPYFACRFEADGVVIDPCGVRMKGNSSFGVPGVKKPFKLDFNQFDPANPALQFHGMKKLSLNNNFKDPTMLREQLFHEFVSQFVPTIRTVPCRLYINGQYWGLYSAAEAVNKDFVQSRFGSDEDGNLYKAEHVIGGTGTSNLAWLGSSPTLYQPLYQLETNETLNDYTGLVDLINALNNTTTADLPAQFGARGDATAILAGLALNNLFVNLDSYNGSVHNYYIYERTDTGLFTHIHWDANEAFGNFRQGVPTGQDARLLSPFFLPSGATHPLMQRLWLHPAWQRAYLRHLARFLRNGFDAASIQPRIHELADIIRADVYADTNKQFTNAQFETNLDSDLGTGGGATYGLTAFVSQRAAYLDSNLDTYAVREDLQLNELMALNVTTIPDNAGDFDPWVEIYNLGPGLVNILDLFLTDTPATPGKWQLPGGAIEDGDFRIYWLDGEVAEGNTHASFTLNPAGGSIYLYKRVGTVYTQLGATTYPAATADVAWGREHEDSAAWAATGQATPGGVNIAAGSDLAGVIFVNELMASNIGTIADELGGFADWIELHNASDSAVDIGGVFLTDDQLVPNQWPIPAGTTIAPRGHLLIWADNDPEQGPMHATFKLSSTGETVGVFDRDGSTLIDLVAFPALGDDVAFGRVDDGGAAMEVLADATPGASNSPAPCPADTNGDGAVDAADLGAVLGAWGTDGSGGGGGNGATADIDGDGTVAASDLALLLGAWGMCP